LAAAWFSFGIEQSREMLLNTACLPLHCALGMLRDRKPLKLSKKSLFKKRF
jgi:hypothetical protein